MAKVLIIDDEVSVCDLLVRYAESTGHEAAVAHTCAEAARITPALLPDVVFLDIFFPDGNGLNLLPLLTEAPVSAEVIVMTGAGDVGSAEAAMRGGAWSYVLKENGLRAFAEALSQALSYRMEKGEQVPQLSAEAAGIIGTSPLLRACLDRAAEAALTEANVFITGETGTGKELLARAIHAHSRRKDHNFVVVDCASLPETLVESILFGHVKGSFTGADRNRQGLIKQADGGTLFMDEVGELPYPLQRKFLRVLQEQQFRPVGGEHEESSKFRLIAATNRDLDAMTDEGRFRQDLLFRLRAFPIVLPPLRERPGDIRLIAEHHLERICRINELPPKQLSGELLDALAQYSWPGNIRELFQALERAVAAGQQRDTLYSRHLPEHIQIEVVRRNVAKQLENPADPSLRSGAETPSTLPPPLRVARERAANQAERDYLLHLGELARGDVRYACTISGLSKSRLYALLQKHGLSLGRG